MCCFDLSFFRKCTQSSLILDKTKQRCNMHSCAGGDEVYLHFVYKGCQTSSGRLVSVCCMHAAMLRVAVLVLQV